MVNNSEVDLLINLCQNPEKATPMDFEKLANLLEQYPDFDLLRKTFVLVGEQFGAKGPNFEKEKTIWDKKRIFYEPAPIKTKSENQLKIENCSMEEKVQLFIEHFKPIHSPY